MSLQFASHLSAALRIIPWRQSKMSNKWSPDEAKKNIIIPNDFILAKLLDVSQRFLGQMFHDEYGFDKEYAHLLADVIRTRDDLIKSLPPSSLNAHGLLYDDTPFLCVLALSGYEFLVAFFAIRCLGGACVPFGKRLEVPFLVLKLIDT